MRKMIVVALAAFSLSACAGLSNTQQRVLTGGALGAGAGLGVGALTGGSLVGGALIGGALGAGGGYLYDQNRRGNLDW